MESEHPRDKNGKFSNKENQSESTKSIGEILQHSQPRFSSRRVVSGVKKINLPQKDAIKCAEAIEKYTRDMFPSKEETTLIDKAIINSEPYNNKTYSGVEKEFDTYFNVGDTIAGRLISWSKNEDVAKDFAIKNTNKMLIVDQNPGMDISDISYEPEEQEVLTATTMKFLVYDIKKENEIQKIYVKYIKDK